MIWTPEKIKGVATRAGHAMHSAWHEAPAGVSFARRQVAVWSVVGSLLAMQVAAAAWENASEILGAPALRSMHRLVMELMESLGDPEVHVIKGDKN